MTAAAFPQIQCTSALQQQHVGMFGVGTGATHSTGTTASPLCSTPVTMFSPSFQPLVQYMQPSYQYPQPPAPIIPPVTNVFEGVPIFLIPQNGLGPNSVSLAALQRATEMKNNWVSQSPTAKVDTSKHFHVFVGDLAAEVDNSALKAAFAPYGEISEAKVIRDPQTMKSKGYGFVSFPLKESAEKAIEGMNGQMIGRRQIRTNWASRKPNGSEDGSTKEQTFEEVFNATRADNTSVYVGNLNSSTTEEEMRETFSTIGTVNEVRIFKQQGYAFVRYATKEAATRAIMHMNGKEIKGQIIRCSWGRTPVDGSSSTNQSLSSLSLIGSSFLGINSIGNPLAWNQNQCLSQFYSQAALQPWQA